MPGFASLKQADVVLTAGQTITLELKMQVAGVQEQITVTGQSPLVEKTSNQIGGTPLAAARSRTCRRTSATSPR